MSQLVRFEPCAYTTCNFTEIWMSSIKVLLCAKKGARQEIRGEAISPASPGWADLALCSWLPAQNCDCRWACECQRSNVHEGHTWSVNSTKELKGGTSWQHCFRHTGEIPRSNSVPVKQTRGEEREAFPSSVKAHRWRQLHRKVGLTSNRSPIILQRKDLYKVIKLFRIITLLMDYWKDYYV